MQLCYLIRYKQYTIVVSIDVRRKTLVVITPTHTCAANPRLAVKLDTSASPTPGE